jgi:hypothetical protein
VTVCCGALGRSENFDWSGADKYTEAGRGQVTQAESHRLITRARLLPDVRFAHAGMNQIKATAFKAIARRSQQSYEWVGFVELWFAVRLTSTTKLPRYPSGDASAVAEPALFAWVQ